MKTPEAEAAETETAEAETGIGHAGLAGGRRSIGGWMWVWTVGRETAGSHIYFRSCRHANLEPPDLARGILEFFVRASRR